MRARVPLFVLFRPQWRRCYSSPTEITTIVGRVHKPSYELIKIGPSQDAIHRLNSCQWGFETLEARRAAGIKLDDTVVEQMRAWLRRIGHKPSDLDRLNVVHVAGTKGKGTTCAFVNSILTRCSKTLGVPAKVGLYTSPHLCSVRERIRINSEPLTEAQFTKYFFEVWNSLEKTAKRQGLDPALKPVYFRFLTLVSFHAFLREGVDTAVYEAGVGGELDSTNVFERPAATGITTLGIDHVESLGETIDKIAWHKAGILKTGSPAFSVRQLPGAETVLRERAEEKGVRIQWVDPNPGLQNVKIKPAEDFQVKNASLAVALTTTVLKKLNVHIAETPDPLDLNDEKGLRAKARLVVRKPSPNGAAQPSTNNTLSSSQPTNLPDEYVRGLEDVVWRARCETKICGDQRYYFDGAHTEESLQVASSWFGKLALERQVPRILIFNQQSLRNAVSLIRTVHHTLYDTYKVDFQHVIFCTNITYSDNKYKPDFVNHNADPEAVKSLTHQNMLRDEWHSFDPNAEVLVMPTIEDAQKRVEEISKEKGEVQTLVTGSFHLVGGFISILEGQDYGLKSTTPKDE
ncbi:uncharacterized protein BP5553_05396 [Venustampulla echinocandica]|uniref:Folylpolyglutamate synthase n=1 Tax=Venustampulla echinocandica TaxID=2656787 RepID=A0A370TR18_9HELO|nr:uncharacterized protein BP5553_05396 [Venustampulla echinocandica]RDL37963.1 hypothetical protein BP5553_05396 [Venustampulla echinocandica]